VSGNERASARPRASVTLLSGKLKFSETRGIDVHWRRGSRHFLRHFRGIDAPLYGPHK
jgi:hypothetical protein